MIRPQDIAVSATLFAVMHGASDLVAFSRPEVAAECFSVGFVISLVTFSTILPVRIGDSLCRSIVLDANDVFAGCSEFCHPGIRGLTIGRGGRYTGRQLAIHDGLDGNANCL